MSAARLFDVIPYSPLEHGAFVRSTWAKGALRDGSAAARARLDALLLESGAWAVVAQSKGEGRLVGWAARSQTSLIFAYVLLCMRRRGIAWLMLHDLGFGQLDEPIPLLYWTPTAQHIASVGGRVFHALYPMDHTERQIA